MSKILKQHRLKGILTKQPLPLRSPAAKVWGDMGPAAREDIAASAIDNPLGVVEVVDELAAVAMSHAVSLDKLQGQLKSVTDQLNEVVRKLIATR